MIVRRLAKQDQALGLTPYGRVAGLLEDPALAISLLLLDMVFYPGLLPGNCAPSLSPAASTVCL